MTCCGNCAGYNDISVLVGRFWGTRADAHLTESIPLLKALSRIGNSFIYITVIIQGVLKLIVFVGVTGQHSGPEKGGKVNNRP
jgi:hypothetical protein